MSYKKQAEDAMNVKENGLEGHVDRIDNGWVFGWALNSEMPNDPIEVEVYVDSKRHATAVANLYRPDLETAGKGNGHHGFEVALTERFRDEEPHRINICFSGTHQDLYGSPQSAPSERKTTLKE